MSTRTARRARGPLPADATQAVPEWSFEPSPVRELILEWFSRHRRSYPWRAMPGIQADAYRVWVSEIMLQQTVIKAVLPVYDRFLSAFPTVGALAAASEDDVRRAVRGLGYYRRFGFLHAAAKQLTAAGAAVPTTHADWRALPGIGDYTAAAIASIALGEPTATVDGNIERLFCRLLDLRRPPNDRALKGPLRRRAQQLLCPRQPGDFNQALMELGQTVCTPKSPQCGVCPVSVHCLARMRGSQALAPAAKLKGPAAVAVEVALAVIARGDQILLQRRPLTARLLKGTWGLPHLDQSATFGAPLGIQADDVVGHVRHTITHHRLRATVHSTTLRQPPTGLAGELKWVLRHSVEEELVSNLDRKAWRLYEARNAQAGLRFRTGGTQVSANAQL